MHVLIVEDEKKMAELLKKGLEEDNHSVNLAFDGREALEMAKALEFDAIVLDLMLPGVDGFEVVRRLRKSGNETP
ncbi:MAG TPA: response regulator, partial [Candidatus Dormibacteraeota bacterium]|nr:response regulator [Candidatus Dormibacteraeota bacterium]